MFRYLLLAEVVKVGVVEVHQGVLEGSDQHGSVIKSIKIAHTKWTKS